MLDIVFLLCILLNFDMHPERARFFVDALFKSAALVALYMIAFKATQTSPELKPISVPADARYSISSFSSASNGIHLRGFFLIDNACVEKGLKNGILNEDQRKYAVSGCVTTYKKPLETGIK